MGVVFTDDQLRTISGEVLAIPAKIIALNAQIVQVQAVKDDMQTKDEGNAAFFDFYKFVIGAYHTEKKNINSVQNTGYLVSDLDDSAQQKNGNAHFPTTPPWVNLSPKLLDSNNGNPTSNITAYEQDSLSKVTVAIAKIKTGFDDSGGSPLTDTLTTVYTPGVDIEVNTGGFIAGQRIVINNLGVSLLALIVTVKPPSTIGAADLALTILTPPLGALGIGSRVRNFHPGWSNAEREETVTLVEPEVLHYFEPLIDAQVTPWETALSNQLTALNANTASGAETGEITAAKSNVSSAKTDIDTWQAAPLTGAGVGRYGNTILTPLESRITSRTSQTSARLTQISTALGSVSQNPDGTFSGTGNYHSLFKWIDMRIKKGSGTLFSYYNFGSIVGFIQSQVATETQKLAEYGAALLVKALTEDAISTIFAVLANITGLAISNTVKVVSDDTGIAVITADIVDIQGNTLELNGTIINALVEKRARVVKEL